MDAVRVPHKGAAYNIIWDGQGLWNSASGIFTSAQKLALGLNGVGYAPCVLLPRSSVGVMGPDISQTAVESPLPEKILKIKPIFSEFAWKTARMLGPRPPLIYHGLSNFNLPILAARGHIPTTKFVLTVNDLIPLIVAPSSKLAVQMKFMLPQALKLADRVVCISQWTKSTLEKQYGDICGSKLEVVTLGVDVTDWNFPFKEDTVWQNDARKRLLLVSRGEVYKRLEFAVEIAMKLNDSRLVIVTNEIGQKNLIRRFGSELLDRTGVIFCVGNVSNQRLQDLYRGADLLLQPSLYEGFGLPAAEAMHAGCPVAFTGGTGTDEVCGTNHFLRFQPTDTSGEWAERLRPLWQVDGGPRRVFRDEITQILAKARTWSQVAARYVEIYTALAEP